MDMTNLKIRKDFFQKIKDFIFFPLRFFLNHETVKRLGLTSLQDERFNVCLPFVKKWGGNCLDIGCGKGNKFIKMLGYGVGLDPYFPEDADVAANAENMPFAGKEFKIITMMGTLRYIKDRVGAMKEIYRVLADDGLVLILETCPLLNTIRHRLIWWNPYKGMEISRGVKRKEIIELAEVNQLKLVKTVRYVYGLSAMYILAKNYEDHEYKPRLN